MYDWIKNLFGIKTEDPAADSNQWSVDKSKITGNYQDLKFLFLLNHGDTFQITFNETGSGINVVLYLGGCLSVECKRFIPIIESNGLRISNVICICDSAGFNLTLVCETV